MSSEYDHLIDWTGDAESIEAEIALLEDHAETFGLRWVEDRL